VIAIGIVVVALDVTTKTLATHLWAAHPLRLLGGRLVLDESRNPGAAFGTATSLTPLLTLIAAVAVVAAVLIGRRPQTIAVALTLGLVLGGAGGNLVDRLFRAPGVMRGHVVDWIDLGWYPSFNLADSSLCIAAVLGVVISMRSARPTPAADQ